MRLTALGAIILLGFLVLFIYICQRFVDEPPQWIILLAMIAAATYFLRRIIFTDKMLDE